MAESTFKPGDDGKVDGQGTTSTQMTGSGRNERTTYDYNGDVREVTATDGDTVSVKTPTGFNSFDQADKGTDEAYLRDALVNSGKGDSFQDRIDWNAAHPDLQVYGTEDLQERLGKFSDTELDHILKEDTSLSDSDRSDLITQARQFQHGVGSDAKVDPETEASSADSSDSASEDPEQGNTASPNTFTDKIDVEVGGPDNLTALGMKFLDAVGATLTNAATVKELQGAFASTFQQNQRVTTTISEDICWALARAHDRYKDMKRHVDNFTRDVQNENLTLQEIQKYAGRGNSVEGMKEALADPIFTKHANFSPGFNTSTKTDEGVMRLYVEAYTANRDKLEELMNTLRDEINNTRIYVDGDSPITTQKDYASGKPRPQLNLSVMDSSVRHPGAVYPASAYLPAAGEPELPTLTGSDGKPVDYTDTMQKASKDAKIPDNHEEPKVDTTGSEDSKEDTAAPATSGGGGGGGSSSGGSSGGSRGNSSSRRGGDSDSSGSSRGSGRSGSGSGGLSADDIYNQLVEASKSNNPAQALGNIASSLLPQSLGGSGMGTDSMAQMPDGTIVPMGTPGSIPMSSASMPGAAGSPGVSGTPGLGSAPGSTTTTTPGSAPGSKAMPNSQFNNLMDQLKNRGGTVTGGSGTGGSGGSGSGSGSGSHDNKRNRGETVTVPGAVPGVMPTAASAPNASTAGTGESAAGVAKPSMGSGGGAPGGSAGNGSGGRNGMPMMPMMPPGGMGGQPSGGGGSNRGKIIDNNNKDVKGDDIKDSDPVINADRKDKGPRF